MKIRSGFVSNSSSSSFVCDVCGGVESGWDLCISDAEMLECTNGHVFHEHEIDKSDENLKAVIAELLAGDAYVDNMKECIEQNDGKVEKVSWHEIFGFDDFCYMAPPSLCPICSFKVIKHDDAVKFLLKNAKTDMETLKKHISSMFGSYEEFMEVIK